MTTWQIYEMGVTLATSAHYILAITKNVKCTEVRSDQIKNVCMCVGNDKHP
jgi:hypothetical protein